MVDWKRGAGYVRRRGSVLDLLRLRRALGEPYTAGEAEEALAPYQMADGSWDYTAEGQDEARIGSLGGTIHCLRWLRELQLGAGPQMARTLEFLASIQADDGSFYETEAKVAHSAQPWLQAEGLIDRFYFTAAVPMRLFSLGYSDHPLIRPAMDWLQRNWASWALVIGTWYNLWALLCIQPMAMRLTVSRYERCYAKATEWLPQLGAQPLTWLLDALQGAGFSVQEPLVAAGLARLRTLQGEDGLWVDRQYSPLETTITALRLLRDAGTVR